MKNKLFAIIALMMLVSPVSALSQDWESIKKNTQTYISGEGWGETIEDADKQALAAIISKISVDVSSNYEQLEGEKTSGDEQEYKKYVASKISTFSNATLNNSECMILSNEPDAHVFRWVKRAEINKIFEGRRAKINEYVNNGIKAETKGKIDDALRNLYWAYTLLKTLQHPSEMKYTDADGTEHVLVTWIPEKMDEIFDEIDPAIVGRNGDDVELYITYKGEPITSLDYTYFDGSRWSNIYSAKDGKGVLELAHGAPGENIQLKYEYVYKNEAHIDREIYDVINVVRGNSMKASYVTIRSKIKKKVVAEATMVEEQNVKKTTESMDIVTDDSAIKAKMDRIIEAISKKAYSSVEDLFTADGLEMWHQLISYGSASLVGKSPYSIYRQDERIVVRSVPMSFSFKRGVRKSFVEDIVFTFDRDGKIECLAFALDEKAASDILNKQAWPTTARMSIIEFLENYKTAFALERLDYIRTIFDDDAVIIVGKVAKVVQNYVPEQRYSSSVSQVRITRTRYSKEQYLKHLARCFASNEFVNIRFANNDVIKAGKGGEIYGIQIKQDYYSTNYGDTGYLFLLVDINNPKEPIIKVRTWQAEPDPVDGLYDLSHF